MSHKANPLNEGFIRSDKRGLAIQAHQQLDRAEEIIVKHGLAVFSKYGEYHADRQTDLEYRVRQIGKPEPGYEIFMVQAAVNDGDGTHPKWSAEKGPGKLWPLFNVAHMTMCNDSKVVESLPRII